MPFWHFVLNDINVTSSCRCRDWELQKCFACLESHWEQRLPTRIHAIKCCMEIHFLNDCNVRSVGALLKRMNARARLRSDACSAS